MAKSREAQTAPLRCGEEKKDYTTPQNTLLFVTPFTMRVPMLLACVAALAGTTSGASVLTDEQIASCGCTFVVNPAYSKIAGGAPFPYYYKFGTALIQPGDVLCFEPGARSSIMVEGVKGTEEKVVTLRACGGVVSLASAYTQERTNADGSTVTLNTGGAISVLDSQHFRVTGGGVTFAKHAIVANGAVTIRALSSDVEVDHLHIQHAMEHGIKTKTDPTCSGEMLRTKFVMRNLLIHDNLIEHIVDGEGMYIGHYAVNGIEHYACPGELLFPHLLENVQIYNNVLYDTGADGIQLAGVISGSVHNNVVEHFGYHPGPALVNSAGVTDHDNGIQVGHGRVHVANNVVHDGPGNGIIMHQTPLYSAARTPTGPIDALPVAPESSYAQVVSHNTVSHVGEHAIYVRTGDTKTPLRLEDNDLKYVKGFGVTGWVFDATSPAVHVWNNKFSNVDLGFAHTFSQGMVEQANVEYFA